MAEAWPNSFTLVNILSGFRKCGIFLINPGAVSDRQLEALRAGREPTSPPFTPEQDALYERRFQEGYDIPYAAWVKINHPSVAPSESSCRSNGSAISAPSSTSGLLKLPKPLPAAKSSREKSLNYRAVCITDDESLSKLKAQEVELDEEKEAKKLERSRKREEEKQAKKRSKRKQRRLSVRSVGRSMEKTKQDLLRHV